MLAEGHDEPLDVGLEERSEGFGVLLIQLFGQAVPEVEGDVCLLVVCEKGQLHLLLTKTMVRCPGQEMAV